MSRLNMRVGPERPSKVKKKKSPLWRPLTGSARKQHSFLTKRIMFPSHLFSILNSAFVLDKQDLMFVMLQLIRSIGTELVFYHLLKSLQMLDFVKVKENLYSDIDILPPFSPNSKYLVPKKRMTTDPHPYVCTYRPF